MLLRDGKFADAYKEASAHVKTTPDRLAKASYYEAMGLASLQQNDITKATPNFKLALSLNPNLPASLAGSAIIIMKGLYSKDKKSDVVIKNTTYAFNFASKAYKLDKSYSYTLAILSDIYLVRRNKSLSKKFAAQVLSSLPSSSISQEEKKMLSEVYKKRVALK